LNSHRLHRRLAIFLVMAGGLLLFTGCQGITGGPTGSGPGTVGLGSSSLNFGSVAIGSSKTLPDTITNNTSSSVTISSIQGLGSGFQVTGIAAPLTLAAGQSASFNVQFQSTSAGDPTVTISFDGPSAQLYASLSATATAVTLGTLSPSPSQVAFGNVGVGANQTSTVNLLNTGGTSLNITSATMSGAGFSMSNLTLPLTLNPGASTSATITFAPTGAGNFSGSVTFATTASQTNSTVVLPFTGTGVSAGTLSPNPASLAFGSVQVSSRTSLSETLTNTGGTSLTISAATASGSGFSLSGLSLPLTLTTGQSTSFTVLFSPTTSGAASGSVSITSTGSNPNLSIPLSGTGVTQGDLVANPTSLAFGSVPINTSKSLSEALTNTGGTSLTISAATASGTGFSLSGLSLPLTLTAGQSTSFTVLFSPTTSGAGSGSLSITSNGPNPNLSIPLSGTGVTQGALAANPASLAFASVLVGSSRSLSETLTNTGGLSITVTQANVTGAVFSISGLTLPVTLTTNQSVTFTATFKPTGAGAASGSLSVVSNASNSPLSIALSGTGTAAGALAVSPTSLSFGNVTDGSSSALSGSLTASGASVTVSSASLNNSEFVLSGISLPGTIAAGQSATFTVTFTPQASGATSASLSFASNASNSPTVETMTGTGTAAVQHTVDLSWTASTDAVSYNIYRGTASGGPYTMINTSPDSTTAYTDSTVVSGQTYYYVATAVNSQSEESGYSNQATAVIPSP
jgi:hypothetical protein